jgi:hypothetical protein
MIVLFQPLEALAVIRNGSRMDTGTVARRRLNLTVANLCTRLGSHV